MSYQYDLYLQKHKANVKKGFDWLQTNMPWLFEGKPDAAWQTEFEHDASKSKPDEYEAYDAYFYGGNRSYAVVQAFQRAWLLHIHRNPHHWQHWVLINDDPGEGEVLLEMPYNYIIEMICDWWAFSWAEGDLSEIFSWYDDTSDHGNPKHHSYGSHGEHIHYYEWDRETGKRISSTQEEIPEDLRKENDDIL